MGLKPGESDCSRCVKRSLPEGGSGACPLRGAIYFITRARGDCTHFVEGDYVTKREKKQAELNPQPEALF